MATRKHTADHYHPLVRGVARALRQRCGVGPGATLVVGCSGGADSVALVRALAMLAPRRKWRLRLVVAHVQHHLRDEAEEDAAFVQRLAEQLALPYARADIRPAELPGNLEANASRLRYAALAQIAGEHDARLIATAHHADDQLETLLMRLLRGSSVAGLRGIAWRKKVAGDFVAIRPMLAADRAAAHALLDQLGQPWREDATNTDTARTRAKLRHDVLPVLKSLQPDAADKANALADHFREVHALVQSAADAAETNAEQKGSLPFEPGGFLSRSQARAMNPAVLAEVLRRALADAGVPLGQLSRHALLPAIQAAQDTAGNTRTFAFAGNTELRITREDLSVR